MVPARRQSCPLALVGCFWRPGVCAVVRMAIRGAGSADGTVGPRFPTALPSPCPPAAAISCV
jgi:hypothetical protein